MQETVNGFNIPLRELTEEEKNREITLERFREFHYQAGEDFLDTTGEGNILIFSGWMLHKYPELSTDIIEIANSPHSEIKSFIELEDEFGYDSEEDIDKIYIDFAEFCNITTALKERVNQTLIQVSEYYSK